jgi:hypothetical protein
MATPEAGFVKGGVCLDRGIIGGIGDAASLEPLGRR